MKLINIIFERKQVGKLYHYTSLEIWENKIKECNCLVALGGKESLPWEQVISTTRNPNIHKLSYFNKLGWSYNSSHPPTLRITLDGDKLSTKYRIGPIHLGGSARRRGFIYDEFEERIHTPVITNLSSYILAVDDILNEIT